MTWCDDTGGATLARARDGRPGHRPLRPPWRVGGTSSVGFRRCFPDRLVEEAITVLLAMGQEARGRWSGCRGSWRRWGWRWRGDWAGPGMLSPRDGRMVIELFGWTRRAGAPRRCWPLRGSSFLCPPPRHPRGSWRATSSRRRPGGCPGRRPWDGTQPWTPPFITSRRSQIGTQCRPALQNCP